MREIEVKIGGKWVPVVASYATELESGYLEVQTPNGGKTLYAPSKWRVLED